MPHLPPLWQKFVPRMPRRHRHWLAGADSLTQKLKSHSRAFSVVRVHQQPAPLWTSESQALNLPRGRRILRRQVLLICDGKAVVFAHTVTDIQKVTRDWHFFNGLGNRALGVALFANPLIRRIAFEYTCLSANDELYAAARHALTQSGFSADLPNNLYARRSVFTHLRHADSRMMVTEVMLPEVYALKKP